MDLQRFFATLAFIGTFCSVGNARVGELLGDVIDGKGDGFTKQYQEDQVDAHEDAVDLFKRYAEGGDNPDLKA